MKISKKIPKLKIPQLKMPSAREPAVAAMGVIEQAVRKRVDFPCAEAIVPENENAGLPEARVIDCLVGIADQRDPRDPPGPPRPPPGPRSPPGPAPNTGFGFIGNSPSRCNFLRASLRARRTASAFSRAFFSEGFS